MHSDPYLFPVTVILFFLVTSAIILHYFKQPSVVAYLISGVLIGPSGFGLIEDKLLLSHLGSFGVVLLLFFVGLEIEIKEILKNWKISLCGTFLQIIVTTVFIFAVGHFFNWTTQRSLFFAFALSLSSTAVVIQYLKEKGEMATQVGKDVLGILIAQDIALVPMLIILGLYGNSESSDNEFIMQIIGGCILVMCLFLAEKFSHKKFKILELISRDKEYQVLSALSFALGLSVLSGYFHLSSALGAFIAGALIRSFKQNVWVHESLEPFRLLFLAIFFASVGTLVDLSFFKKEWFVITLITVLALVINTFVNMVILRFLGRSWKDSFYAGALLSQLGELTFVLATIALSFGIINDFSYNATIIVVFLTMLVTPIWISTSNMLRNNINRKRING